MGSCLATGGKRLVDRYLFHRMIIEWLGERIQLKLPSFVITR
tara:strand:- start:1384 stop:1509 length:126 start_codon:yes stop_codon:yes gene_type:complete